MFCLIFSLFSFNKYKNTGNVQTFTAPISTTYILEVWGAQGGNPTTTKHPYGNGGCGAYAKGNYNINKDNSIYIAVGGKGANSTHEQVSPYYLVAGGWNGGGSNSAPQGNGEGYDRNVSSAGGGATSITTHDRGELCNFEDHKTEIIIVAGAGGGGAISGSANMPNDAPAAYLANAQSGAYTFNGAPGGMEEIYYGPITVGYKWNNVETPHYILNQHLTGYSGTQTEGGSACTQSSDETGSLNGSFGKGGDSGKYGCGAGGGGYYGGGGGGHQTGARSGGGGGGSSYIGGVTNGIKISGDQSFPKPGGGTETGHAGNGYCIISWHPSI